MEREASEPPRLECFERFSFRFSDTNTGKQSVSKPPSKTATVSILKDPAKGKGSKDQNDLKPKEPTVNDTRIEVRRSALIEDAKSMIDVSVL